MEEPRRNLSEAKADMFDDEETVTTTSVEQVIHKGLSTLVTFD